MGRHPPRLRPHMDADELTPCDFVAIMALCDQYGLPDAVAWASEEFTKQFRKLSFADASHAAKAPNSRRLTTIRCWSCWAPCVTHSYHATSSSARWRRSMPELLHKSALGPHRVPHGAPIGGPVGSRGGPKGAPRGLHGGGGAWVLYGGWLMAYPNDSSGTQLIIVRIASHSRTAATGRRGIERPIGSASSDDMLQYAPLAGVRHDRCEELRKVDTLLADKLKCIAQGNYQDIFETELPIWFGCPQVELLLAELLLHVCAALPVDTSRM